MKNKNSYKIESQKMDANNMDISRKEAIKKIGTYGKHAAFISLSTYLILTPMKGQAQSVGAGAAPAPGGAESDVLGLGFDD
jgi:hypothetical protein